MYSSILTRNFEQLRSTLTRVISIDSVKKTIAVSGDQFDDVWSKNSQILVYYDVISNTQPLLMVERVERKQVKLRELKRKITELNNTDANYNYSIASKKCKKYIDIIVVNSAVYDNLRGVQ